MDGDVTYFDSFGVECIPKKLKKSIETKYITTNSYSIQAYDPMCEYFCIGFIEFMLDNKGWLTNLNSPNNFEKNDKIILGYCH